jgi:hypothetical protein
MLPALALALALALDKLLAGAPCSPARLLASPGAKQPPGFACQCGGATRQRRRPREAQAPPAVRVLARLAGTRPLAGFSSRATG